MTIMEGWEGFHPSLAILSGSQDRLMKPDHPFGALFDDASKVRHIKAIRVLTERCAERVLKHDKSWFMDKAKILQNDEDLRNAAGILAEIRGYGGLLAVCSKEELTSLRKNGPDFMINDSEGLPIRVEISTRQAVDAVEKTEREMEFGGEGCRMSIKEKAPFGLPVRKAKRIEKGDNVQGDCVSIVIRVKEEEHQLADDTINILWYDLADSRENLFFYDYLETLPLFSLDNRLTCGCLWHAFYAQQGDPVFTQLPTRGGSGNVYHLEFPGRFEGGSKIDAVVIEQGFLKAVFQNHLSGKFLSDALFDKLLRLEYLSYQNSWIDWPIRGSLPDQIRLHRERIKGIREHFK
jgi:hypothetical protein